MTESIIIRLADSTEDPDGELRGIVEWVRSGQSASFDSSKRLIDLLVRSPRDPVEGTQPVK
jgi:hypothetical protein